LESRWCPAPPGIPARALTNTLAAETPPTSLLRSGQRVPFPPPAESAPPLPGTCPPSRGPRLFGLRHGRLSQKRLAWNRSSWSKDTLPLPPDSPLPKTTPAHAPVGISSCSPVASISAPGAPRSPPARSRHTQSSPLSPSLYRRAVPNPTQSARGTNEIRRSRKKAGWAATEHGGSKVHRRGLESPVNSSGLDHSFILRQFGAQAPFELLAQLRDFHPRHHNELAGQHFPRIIVIRQLAAHSAILAILVPAESPIRNRLRADELKAAQQRIPLRHMKLLSEQCDLDQFFVRTEGFRHDKSSFRGFEAGLRCFPVLQGFRVCFTNSELEKNSPALLGS